jgi:tRNA1Val (adenine37-N6)-methyltransferase
MASSPFKFKQFTIEQDKSAMKIGTDGALIGAWTSIKNKPNSILDIGSGTGIIALQLAQRSTAESIDAIEIDDNAFEQCIANFENSPWGDRLFCYHSSIQEFAQEMPNEADFEPYDLIVSNPPFFETPLENKINPKSQNSNIDKHQRAMARFTDALPFDHLIICAAHLLSDKGVLAVVIPSDVSDDFIETCNEHRLFLLRKCSVQGTASSAVKRCLLEFSFEENTPTHSNLIIEKSRHDYTSDYKELVKDFYLKM